MSNSNSPPAHIIGFNSIVDAAIAMGEYLGKGGSDVMQALGDLTKLADSLRDFSFYRNTEHWYGAYSLLFSNGFTKYKPHINIAQNVLVTLLDDTNMPISVGFYERHINAGPDMGHASILNMPGQKKGHGIMVYSEYRGAQVVSFSHGRAVSVPKVELEAKIHFSIHKTEMLRQKMGKLPPKARGIVPAKAGSLPKIRMA